MNETGMSYNQDLAAPAYFLRRLTLTRSTRRRRIVCAALAVLAACNEPTVEVPTVIQPASQGLTLLSDTSALAQSGSSSGTATAVTFASLPPNTLLTGEFAVVLNRRTGASLTIPIVNGGFDPTAVTAASGDTIEVTVLTSGSGPDHMSNLVPPRRRPRVVRTDPPPFVSDVPLRTRPHVVFSEPIDPNVATTGGIALRLGGQPVAARVERSADGLSATLVPTEELRAGTTYELIVTDAVHDMDGDALDAPVSVTFTTAIADLPDFSATRIAFVSTRNGSAEIFVANADGSAAKRVTTGEAPAWSRDGLHIAFHETGGLIYTMDAAGLNRKSLAEGFYPAWSPDGTQIAFNGPVGVASGGIFVVNADGSGRRKLIGYEFASPDDGYGPGWVGLPVWSPDGRRIAFVRANYGIVWSIYIMNANGSSPRLLELSHSVGDSRFQWSPDGSRLLVQRSGGLGFLISSVKTDGSDLRDYASASLVGDPDWSPDGNSILFTQATVARLSIRQRIFTVGAAGGVPRQLVPDAVNPVLRDYSDYHGVWSRVRD